MSTLTDELVEAIESNDLEGLQRIISICDMLHKGVGEVDGYTEKDMPTDKKYEEGLEQLRTLEQLETVVHSQPIPIEDVSPVNSSRLSNSAKATKNTLILMDSIEMAKDIPTIKNALLMPKFDGCSIGVEITKTGSDLQIIHAHTRGTDDLSGYRNCQDATEYLKIVGESLLKRMNKKIKKLSKPENADKAIIDIKYKDESKIGNTNKPLTGTIDLTKIDHMLIRGEFVSNDKENSNIEGFPKTPVGLAAGAINSKIDKFNEYKDYIDYIPFEIALIRINKIDAHREEIIEEFIPTQLSALTIMEKLDMIDYPTFIADEIDETFDMEKYLKHFEKHIKQPLDGVVYCPKYWTYPKTTNETAKKVNYGKYKWKRHNSKQVKLLDITYAIGKTGNITPSFCFEPVKINKNTYKRAKTTFDHIDDFITQCKENKSLFGNGLMCELELMSNMNPMITSIYPKASKITKEITILDTCPYCKKELTRDEKTTKDKRIIIISCDNNKCPGVLCQQLKDFFKQIGFKGIGEKRIEEKEYKDFKSFYESFPSSLKNKFDDIISEISISKFIVSASICTRANIPKLLKKFEEIKGTNLLIKTLSNKENEDFIKEISKNNYFVKNLIKSLKKIYC